MTEEERVETAAANMLECVAAIVDDCTEHNRKTGAAYNVFNIAGIGEKEVIMCRVFADLLNPKGDHYQGSVYLKFFMDEMEKELPPHARFDDLSKVKVALEFSTGANRRIDITLDDGAVFIPIEVKINAGEQEDQVADYAAESRTRNNSDIPVLFLTKDGRDSTDTSLKKGKDYDYVPISFAKHIAGWLGKCHELETTKNVPPVREIIKQLAQTVKSFCGYAEEESMSEKINKLVMGTKDGFETALRIWETVNELDNKVVEKFWGEIRKLVHGAERYEEGKQGGKWQSLKILVVENYELIINYDWKSMFVQTVDSAEIDDETANKIISALNKQMGLTNAAGVWSKCRIGAYSPKAAYPGIKNTGDDKIYKYELFQAYSTPQNAADEIKKAVNNLKNIIYKK
ncbi:MAG: PD-(D/E)XK nuclease family protein [Kiritimatiellaeota bacterium]|nr:PD-(D/E)XK nuclease family protein [Kiritimatiellota bacterium]